MKIDGWLNLSSAHNTKYSYDPNWRRRAAWIGPNPYNKQHLVVQKQELAWAQLWQAHNLNLAAKSLSVAVLQVAR